MRIPSKKPAMADVDMTPMIDIVFQLIAFFMVITNFEQTEADERVTLPRDELASPPEVKPAKELTINVGFDRDKRGRKLDPLPFVFYAGERIRVLNFGRRLKQESEIYEQTGTDPKDVVIGIRADAEVPTGLVQELIKLSQEAGFEQFALKAKQSQVAAEP